MDDARRCILARRTFAATARRKHVLRRLLVGEMAKKEEEKSPHLNEKGHLVKVIVCAQNNVAISFCRMPGVNQLTTSKQTDAIRQYKGLLCNSPTQVAKARCWGLLLLCQGLQSMYVCSYGRMYFLRYYRAPANSDIDTSQAIYFRHGRPSF